jgi:hypothetical protein
VERENEGAKLPEREQRCEGARSPEKRSEFELSVGWAVDMATAEEDRGAELFRLLAHDQAEDDLFSIVADVGRGASARREWFCVRCLSADGRPAKKDPRQVQVSVSHSAGSADPGRVELDTVALDEGEALGEGNSLPQGWCHHNVSFEIKSGRSLQRQSLLVTVRARGSVVLEKVIRVTFEGEEIVWNSELPHSTFFGPEGFREAIQHGDERQPNCGSLERFRSWAEAGAWQNFGPGPPHFSHYDWWMFPIDSAGKFKEYKIGALKRDEEYMGWLREAVTLMVKSWGFDLDSLNWCSERSWGQRWRNWPVRLKKLGQCLVLFGEMELFNSVRLFVVALEDDRVNRRKVALKFRKEDADGNKLRRPEPADVIPKLADGFGDPRAIFHVPVHDRAA